MDPDFEKALKDPRYFKEFAEEWHGSRIDLFRLTLTSGPNEVPKFHGVIRFYFQDRGQKASTKCLRFNNEQTVSDIMPQLIEKFCPDMKMLSTPNYELFEIHSTGDVRKLTQNEKPLLVQLFWHKDDREGRFLLKSADLKIQARNFFVPEEDSRKKEEGVIQRSVYRLSKRYRKKRKEEMAARKRNPTSQKDAAMAQELFRDLPESNLTRTKSNPEAVMRRRRQQKLEKRMKEFQNKGGPQTGGILKIFAESLKPEIPYKTILASVKDNATIVTRAALEKFLLPKEDPEEFCIVMAIIPTNDPKGVTKEQIIRSTDCPLAIQNSWPKENGVITFHLRKKVGLSKTDKNNERSKSTSSVPNKRNKKGLQKERSSGSDKTNDRNNEDGHDRLDKDKFNASDIVDRDLLPYFLELTPEGKEINYKPKIYYIRPNETVIGSSRNPSPGVQYLQLFSPKILASHCSIVNAHGTVSIVPHGPDADVCVSGQPIYDNTLLQSGHVVQFGGLHTFRFHNPRDDPPERNSIASDENMAPFKTPSPPISPELKEMVLNQQAGSAVDDEVIETTFGIDGGIETNAPSRGHLASSMSVEDVYNPIPIKRGLNHASLPDLLDMHDDVEENLLPASLTFLDQGRDAFFAAIISGVNGAAVNFKLAPTYTLYLAARHIISPNYRPGLNPSDRTRMLSGITKRIATSVQQTIQENDSLAGGLAFWMANASELLHFYRQDSDIGPLTKSAQAILAQSIQEAFALLVNAMEEELSLALPAFLDPSEHVDIHFDELDDILNDDLLERAESMELLNWTNDGENGAFSVTPMDEDGRPLSGGQWISPAARIRHNGSPVMADILYILSSAMSLLRRCRVNAALTIQLFSQLFHFINMWTFNRIVFEPELGLCSGLWGHCLRMRLSFIEAWAERQGLELAADCHLARIVQTAHLLEAPKDSAEDISNIAAVCFKLNSLQLRYLLESYIPERDELEIPQELIEYIVEVAEKTSDQLTHNDGRDVKLEEDFQLQLPFLLPEEGYSSDIIRGVPPGLQEFLEPLCATGLCELSINPHSSGLWTVYQEPYENEDGIGDNDDTMDEAPPIQRITIDKGKTRGLGLSICAAKGAQSEFNGIYIKAVIEGGIADTDGRLEAGDQIISANESSLIDVTQQQAAKIMGKSGPVITLEVMKRAAFYHGLHKLVENEENTKQNNDNNHNSRNRHSRTEHMENNDINRNSYDMNNQSFDRYDDRHDGPKLDLDYPSVQTEDSFHDIRYANHASTSSTHNESDYDSDGNLLTPEEKATQAKLKQRQLEYEMRLAKMEEERMFLEEERKLQEEELVMQEEELRRKQSQDEELERRRIQAEQWARDEELELEREAELRYEEEARQLRLEEERQAAEERKHAERFRVAEERRFQEKKLAEERRLQEKKLAEERRLQEKKLAEEKRLQEKKLAEERRLQEEEGRLKEQERVRLEQERRRKREEEERKRIGEQERIEKVISDEETKIRLEKERRAEEERKRIESEERIKKAKAEQERKRKQDIEYEKTREAEEQRRKEYFIAEQNKRREEEEKKAEESRKKEKQRLIEERKRKEEVIKKEQQLRYERQQKEAEEKRRKDEEDKQRHVVKKEPERINMQELDLEMASIDDALREAEKIAAEMDLFMLEEEQKIEEDVKQKHKEEQKQWSALDAFAKKDPNHNNNATSQQKVYRVQTKNVIKRSSSRENLLEINFDSTDLLPPPENVLSSEDEKTRTTRAKYETNIDSSSDEEERGNNRHSNYNSGKDKANDNQTAQQRWVEEQKEKRARQKQEQERMRRERMKKQEDEREQRMREIEMKKEQENKEMNAYLRSKQGRDGREKEETDERIHPPPVVKPKNFSIKTGNKPGIVHAIRGEYKTKAELDYERRRGEIDNLPHIKNSISVSNYSSDEDAPPRPPPPRNLPTSPRTPPSLQQSKFRYSSSNGHRNTRPISTTGEIVSETGLIGRHGQSGFVKRTPEPAVVNQGVGEPEVLDFRAKMKMFGKFQ